MCAFREMGLEFRRGVRVEARGVASTPPALFRRREATPHEKGACGRFPNLPHAIFNPPLVENLEIGKRERAGERLGKRLPGRTTMTGRFGMTGRILAGNRGETSGVL